MLIKEKMGSEFVVQTGSLTLLFYILQVTTIQISSITVFIFLSAQI